MTTAAQIAANRKNALKSTGPRTSRGKRIARMNSLKHGMTALTKCLPNEDPDEFREFFDLWLDAYASDDPAEMSMVWQAAGSAWRLKRCMLHETAVLSKSVRDSKDVLERAVNASVHDLGEKLLWDPICRVQTPQTDPVSLKKQEEWHRRDPAVIARDLQSTVQGVDWLIARWKELETNLQHELYWHYNEKFRAIRLLGKRFEDVMTDYNIARIYVACNVLHPEAWPLLNEVIAGTLGSDGKPVYNRRIEMMLDCKPSREIAFQYLMDLIAKEVARLEALKVNSLNARLAADLAEVEARAMFDDSAEAALRLRYETAVQREFHRSVISLKKFQRDNPPLIEDEPEPEPEPTPEVPASEPAAEPQSEPAAEPKSGGQPLRNEPNPGPAPGVTFLPISIVKGPETTPKARE